MAEKLKHPFVWLVAALLVGSGIYWLWHHGQRYESTDNAYVNAHVVRVGSQVTGQIVELHVDENQKVNKGDVLLRIDPAPFKIAVDRAAAQVQQARYQLKRSEASLHDAEAALHQREAELQNAIARNNRAQELMGDMLISKETADLAATQLKTAEASVDSARARLAAERANLGSGGDDNEVVRQALAALQQAQWDLGNCDVVAPVSGEVSNLQIRSGDVVARNQTLFTIIDSSEFWIDANFKETQLARVVPGLEAEIRVDMYPDKVFRGKVDSISGGSGTAFSLLPSQNATGNWVKIAQRVPVKVRVLDLDPKFPLRIGTSGSVRVKVKG